MPTKTLLLLDAMRDAGTLDRYVPFDVSESVLLESAERLVEQLPGPARVRRRWATSSATWTRCPPAEGPRVIAFLGGTIGNFPPGSRRKFLRSLGRALRPQDRLLLGTDLVKDPAVLEAAYNDAAGVTAAFNRNLLAVHQPRAATPTSTSTRSSTSRSTTASRSGSRCACARCGRMVVNVRRARPRRALRQPRGAAHRDQREVHARADRGDLRAAGLRLHQFLTDDDGLFALSLSGP